MKHAVLLLFTFSSSITHAQTVRPYAPELFPENISGAVCGFSKDGKTIYFVREDATSNKLWLYEAKRINDKWANEKLLPFSGTHSDLGGRFNHDKTEFYFTSDRPGGSDDVNDAWNIWKVRKTKKGWEEPVALKEINNKGMECCPVPLEKGRLMYSGSRNKLEWQIFIDEKPLENVNISIAWQWPSSVSNNYLLFNSMKRSDSKGMDDVYLSKFENGTWTPAKNVGEPINTAAYEDGAILSHDGKLLIFCRHDTAETPSRVLCVDISSTFTQ